MISLNNFFFQIQNIINPPTEDGEINYRKYYWKVCNEVFDGLMEKRLAERKIKLDNARKIRSETIRLVG